MSEWQAGMSKPPAPPRTPRLADVAGDDAEQVVGLVERLLVVGDVGLLAGDATSPGEGGIGVIGGHCLGGLAVSEGVRDDEIEAVVGVAADRPLGVAFRNELGVGEFADQPFLLESHSAVVHLLVPRQVVDLSRQDQSDADPVSVIRNRAGRSDLASDREHNGRGGYQSNSSLRGRCPDP